MEQLCTGMHIANGIGIFSRRNEQVYVYKMSLLQAHMNKKMFVKK